MAVEFDIKKHFKNETTLEVLKSYGIVEYREFTVKDTALVNELRQLLSPDIFSVILLKYHKEYDRISQITNETEQKMDTGETLQRITNTPHTQKQIQEIWTSLVDYLYMTNYNVYEKVLKLIYKYCQTHTNIENVIGDSETVSYTKKQFMHLEEIFTNLPSVEIEEMQATEQELIVGFLGNFVWKNMILVIKKGRQFLQNNTQ